MEKQDERRHQVQSRQPLTVGWAWLCVSCCSCLNATLQSRCKDPNHQLQIPRGGKHIWISSQVLDSVALGLQWTDFTHVIQSSLATLGLNWSQAMPNSAWHNENWCDTLGSSTSPNWMQTPKSIRLDALIVNPKLHMSTFASCGFEVLHQSRICLQSSRTKLEKV
jgi:hypothetical protein